MDIQYSIHNNQDHLRAEVSGNLTPGKESEELIRIGEEIINSCRKFGVNRIIAVINIAGHIQIWDAHKVVTSAEAFGCDSSLKLALVYTHEERFEKYLFTEILAASRGFQFKSFRNELSAKSWLFGKSTASYSRRKSIFHTLPPTAGKESNVSVKSLARMRQSNFPVNVD